MNRKFVFTIAAVIAGLVISFRIIPAHSETPGAALDREQAAQDEALQNEITDRRGNDAQHNAAIDALRSADDQILAELARQAEEIERLKAAGGGGEPAPQPGPARTLLLQLGLNFFDYVSAEEPMANLLRVNGCQWAAHDAQGKKPRMPCLELLAAGFIDPATMLPTAIPADYEVITSGIFRDNARHYPEFHAGTYVACWDGVAALRVQTRKISDQCSEFDFPPSLRDHAYLEFSKIGAGFSNPRVYRKENAAEAGELFSRRWLALLHQYDVIRTMDIQGTNTSWIRSVDHLAKKQHFGWGQSPNLVNDSGVVVPFTVPKGVPIEALFDMAVASDTRLWMHVAGIVGAPPVFDDAKIYSGEKSVRALAKEHARAIIASPEWRKYAKEIVRSLKVSGYPKDRPLYIEQSNEVWNFAHPFWRNTNYFWGLAEGIKGDSSVGFSWGLGYVTANFAVILDAEMKAEGRGDQPWVAVLAGQMANTETTKGALAGFKAFFDANPSIARAPFYKRLGVSTASYYQGALEEPAMNALLGPARAGEDYVARWLRVIKDDGEALKKRATDYIISGPVNDVGTLPNLVRQRNAHQKLAEDAGAFSLGDYEGESHESGGGALKSIPAFVNWVEDWRAGPEGERMTRAWVEAMKAQNPNAIIANFNSIGPRDPEGNAANDNVLAAPWIDNFWGEETGRTRALAPYLRAN